MGDRWMVLIGCIAGDWLWYTRQQSTATTAPQTVTVARKTFSQTVTGSGNLAPVKTGTVVFQTSGEVQSVMVAVGDRVRRGQTLARLDDQPAHLALQEA